MLGCQLNRTTLIPGIPEFETARGGHRMDIRGRQHKDVTSLRQSNEFVPVDRQLFNVLGESQLRDPSYPAESLTRPSPFPGVS